nr:hypothetical protein CparaKRNrm3_p098 [Cryptomonas paramecium]
MYFLETKKKNTDYRHLYSKKNNILKLFFLHIQKKKYLKKYFLGSILFYFIVASIKWKKLYKKIKNNNFVFFIEIENNIYAKIEILQKKVAELIFFLVKYFFLVKSFGKMTSYCFQMIFHYNQKFNKIKLKFDECLIQKLYFVFKHQIYNKKKFMKKIYQLSMKKKKFTFEFSVEKFFSLFHLLNFQQTLALKNIKKNLPIDIVSFFLFFFFFRMKSSYMIFFKKISSFFISIERYIKKHYLKFCVNRKKFCVLCEFIYFFFYKNIYTFMEYIKHLKCQKYPTNDIPLNLTYNFFFNLIKKKKHYEYFSNTSFSNVKQKINRKNFSLISKYYSFSCESRFISIFRLFEIGIELHLLWFSLKLCEFSFVTFKNVSLNLSVFLLLKKKFFKFENRFFNFFFYFKQKMLILKKNNSILKKISLEKNLNKHKFQKKLYEIKNMETDFIEILNKINT